MMYNSKTDCHLAVVMGRIDSLNIDCMELIFCHLHGKDLVAISLVSRPFLIGVIPMLYRTLFFGPNHAQRYSKAISCFGTILTHPHLAINVRHIDIRAAPALSGGVNPHFVKDSRAAIMLCENLLSFVCILPNLFSHYLRELPSRAYLDSIRVQASLKTDESPHLLQFSRLRHLTLDSATWNVIDILPNWTSSLQSTLRTLTLYSLKDLDSSILEPVLQMLPKLTALHVVSCRTVDYSTVIRLTKYTPLLQSLAFSSWTKTNVDLSDSEPLPHLRHLAVDFQFGSATYFDNIGCASVFRITKFWDCSLSALTIKLSHSSVISDTFMKPLIRTHAATLTHLSMINCLILDDHFRRIAHRCKKLERLAVIVPHKSIGNFASGLSRSSSLKILQDLNSASPSLSKDSVRMIMQSVPSIQRITTSDRIWSRNGSSNHNDRYSDLIPEKKYNPRPNHWFVPSG